MRRFHFALIAAAGLLPAPLGLTAVSTSANVATQMSEKLFHKVDEFCSQQVASLGGRYRPPKLTFFAEPISGVCDVQAALVGPFYCPVNETVYLDRQILSERARNDLNLALGYVVAHEVAHHIQNVIGTTSMVDEARARSTPELAQRTFTAMELQADCYSGLWARWADTRGLI
jgi:hypothetical protein